MGDDREEDLPRLLGGRYRLEAKLGQGGMGVVYRGVDTRMERPVAVKLIRGEEGVDIEDPAAERFLREAKNTARLQHEHIVEVFDLGRGDAGELYFVMEFLPGESLSKYIRREGRVPVTEGVHVGIQICEALHVAHTAGIIHRDLKPGNVMIVPRAADDWYVKVLDFGVSKSMSQQTQLTGTGMLVGTLEYMAPEQILARGVDARTDIYALGALLYRALTGTPVFKEGGMPALIHNHLNTLPELLVDRAPAARIPPALDAAVRRCLAKRPDARFATMVEVARELRRAIDEVLDALPSFDIDDEPEAPSWARTTVAAPSFSDVEPDPDDEARTRVMHDRRRPDATVVEDRSRPRSSGRGQVSGPPGEAVLCAMCHRPNDAGAARCAACGVSLAPEDQAAMRSRTRGTGASRPPSAPPPRPARVADTPAAPPPSAWGRVLSRLRRK